MQTVAPALPAPGRDHRSSSRPAGGLWARDRRRL